MPDTSKRIADAIKVTDFRAFGKQIVEWDGDPAADPFAGALLFDGMFRTQREQLAFFGELTWDILDGGHAEEAVVQITVSEKHSVGGRGGYWAWRSLRLLPLVPAMTRWCCRRGALPG